MFLNKYILKYFLLLPPLFDKDIVLWSISLFMLNDSNLLE